MFVYKDVTKCHSFGEGVLKKFFYGVKMPFFARGGQKNLQISSLSKKNWNSPNESMGGNFNTSS